MHAVTHTHTHTAQHTLSCPTPTSPRHTPLHTLTLALMGMGWHSWAFPQSATSSSLLHMFQLPQPPPLCPLPQPHLSPICAQPEWLILSGCLARSRHCLHLKSLPQLHSQPGSERRICLHLRALGDMLRGWRPPGTQGCPLLGDPQIGFCSQDSWG